MMKKVMVLCFVFMFSVFPLLDTFAVLGDTEKETNNSYIEYFADGSYGIVEITYSNLINSMTSTKSGQKKYTYYSSSNVKQWVIYLNGTFSYTGSSASCTASSTSYSISNTAWSVTKAQASRSGATATGSFTVKRYELGVLAQTVNKTLTLTCSASGVLS